MLKKVNSKKVCCSLNQAIDNRIEWKLRRLANDIEGIRFSRIKTGSNDVKDVVIVIVVLYLPLVVNWLVTFNGRDIAFHRTVPVMQTMRWAKAAVTGRTFQWQFRPVTFSNISQRGGRCSSC